MKFLAVDGNSILNRAFYGIRALSTKSGIPTNAVYGFLSTLLSMKKAVEPDCIAVAFDLKAPTFRHEKYDAYKAGRKGMPDELALQLPIVKEILKMLGIAIVEAEGYEADDILGTFARLCCENEENCVIATGDRDSLQLVSNCVTVRLATNKEPVLYDEEKIKQDYGISPQELIEVKALMGDSSDNIPGVKGIGEKTALSLIKEYKTIEYIYDNIDTIEIKPRVRNLLTADGAKESAFLSRELGTVFCEVPVEEDFASYLPGEPDTEKLLAKFKELEMYSMPEKFNLITSNNKPVIIEEKQAYPILVNPSIDAVQNKLKNMDTVDFLADFNGGISVLYIALQEEAAVFNFNAEGAFSALVQSNDKPKRTHDVKALYHYLLQTGQELYNVKFDLALAAYLLDANAKSYEINALKEAYQPDLMYNVEEPYKKIAVFPSLCDLLNNQIAVKGMTKLLEEVELPLSLVLADMEVTGVAVDREGIVAFGSKLEERIGALRDSIFHHAGEEFNPNSTKELGNILFDKLHLPVIKKNKTGYSTDAATLEKLQGQHPIIDDIMEYRQLTKLNSTYVVGLLKVIGDDGRVHSLFRQTETRTGRISSTEPNMQNIPIRTELGREMRKFFVAPNDTMLVDADYSQIELRILAHISNDLNMIEGFQNNIDIHAITASQVFHVPLEEVPSSLRSNAKAINFGIVYGIGPFSLSKDIHVTVAEAKDYIEKYLETYSGVRSYMQRIKQESYDNGYVTTMFNRRRDLPELKQKNRNIVAFGERIALNTPIQGSAADIIKIAMVKVYNRLKEEKLQAKLILQVHDELIIEAKNQDCQRAAVILREEMESAATLSVPLVADVSTGKTWYEAKE